MAHPDTTRYVEQHMLNLLTVLRTKSLMPTLVFSFEESDCHQLVEHVVSQLENAENAYRQTREFKEYEADMARKAADQQAVMERMAKGVGRVRETDDDGNVNVRHDEIQTVDVVQDFTIPEVLPQFSFLGAFDVVSAADMADIRYNMKDDDLVFRAFIRGIGIHTGAIKG